MADTISPSQEEDVQDRSMEGTMKALHSLISRGIQLEIAAQTREQCIELMQSYMKRLDIDASKLSIIHVAGTKGKGSTCAFVESILQSMGYRTGLFTSPHLVDLQERFRINGKPVSEKNLLKHFWGVWDDLRATKEQAAGNPVMPMFFRFLTLVCLRMYLDAAVDVLILEVGMGGRFDPTNCTQEVDVAAITLLDYDHCQYLGNTLEEIAYQKAGIIKTGALAFTVPQDVGALEVLRKCAQEAGATLMVVPSLDVVAKEEDVELPTLSMTGSYQYQNAALAYQVCKAWVERFHAKYPHKTHPFSRRTVSLRDPDVVRGISRCHWPGRCHEIAFPDQNVIYYLDGAHTEISIRSAGQWYSQRLLACAESNSSQVRVLVFNCGHERKVSSIITALLAEAKFDHIFITPMGFTRPSRFSPLTAEAILREAGVPDYKGKAEDDASWESTLRTVFTVLTNGTLCRCSVAMSAEDCKKRVDNLVQDLQAPVRVLVTGSLYLVGGLLRVLGWTALEETEDF